MTPDERKREFERELEEGRQFAAEIEAYERAHFDPVRDAAEDAEYEKLVARYPGEWVAFLDAWDGQTLTRQVLVHEADLGRYMAVAETWPEDVRERVQVTYIHPPGALCTRILTGEIRPAARPRG
jgi:hypothetical protein